MFPRKFASCVLSTVAARSVVGIGWRSLCTAILIGGDKHALFYLFGKLLDGLMEMTGSWAQKGSFLEPSNSLSRMSRGSC